jgi:hypothetical protein
MSTSTDLSLLINGYQRHGRRQATEHNLLALEHDMARCQVSIVHIVQALDGENMWKQNLVNILAENLTFKKKNAPSL